MSDATHRTLAPPLRQPSDAPPDVLVAITGLEANDNGAPVTKQQPEIRMFELPALVWRIMVACYATFLLALLGATGGSHAFFAITISAVYVAMFFGTARVMLKQALPQPRSPLDRRVAALQTAYGPLPRGEVYGQVLIVPVAVAVFGIAISIVAALVM